MNWTFQKQTLPYIFRGITFRPRPRYQIPAMATATAAALAVAKAGTTQCKVVLAATVAKTLFDEVQTTLKTLQRKPKLVGFLANDDPASRTYAEWTEKTCEQYGLEFELREVDKDELEQAVIAANEENAVDGGIIYFPVFGTKQDQYLQQILDVSKDVEGLSHKYIFNMYQNIRFLDEAKTQKSILPCTPLAVIKILEYIGVYNKIIPYGNRLFGRTIAVINRSEVVGRPLAALLANDGASVYSVDINNIQHFTRGEGVKMHRHHAVDTDLKVEDVIPKCDVVITGVPSKGYKFPVELLKDGAICINFSSEENFGPEVMNKASIYVPAIGRVTIAILLRNLVRLCQYRQINSA
ncbi:NAD-dependent 5,10-methylenetetrahydrafolate dehydrogenase [Orbilia oligospora]|uniref:Methylenetetrahydrofolate dehydrogenase [NAD(+)] n=1 Tax=Orbilia oligospora TaxID=2813651 RepID=A0A8H2DXS5_ORBOL|nr:NAD-dependent 5,10-methylenetetrahydrafolate dehydrogenase [Orbilia oligospora]KAF3240819.1 NAD-dependent 5,10-methylenetetrahydrafolate dehydrogenase [Orbilia oligospora]KAF3253183.1 NAD-dependent 5,10-methylenetetrahydrafolate dehydrogenase [Orbilia oligospora]TGJ66893.1 NAD-dependent 5,10-methylenetetrahydrafolate dehydrogenase [Orbilia oligospora]